MAKLILRDFRVLLFEEGAARNVDSLMQMAGAKHRYLPLGTREICTTSVSQERSREDPLLYLLDEGTIFRISSVIVSKASRHASMAGFRKKGATAIWKGEAIQHHITWMNKLSI